jgi:hypothetical protein
MLRALLLGLLVVASASDALAQSQRQPQQRPPSSQSTQPTASDQRGTDQVPFAVKILPAETAKKEAEKAEAEKAEKAAIDKRLAFDTQRLADYTWWLANYTWWLAAFTALVFTVAILQVGMFAWQLILIKRGTRDATKAANAALLSAQVARNEFIATHRPRLRVYAFDTEDRDLVHDKPIVVLLQTQNIGDTPAHITRVEGCIHIAPNKNRRIESNIPLRYRQDFAITLVSGEREAFSIEDGTSVTEFTATAVYAGDRPLFCIGRIFYTDDAGIGRETGFCRRFSFRPYGSEPVPESEYEYQY